jgi:hypothetical protein
MPTGNRNNLYQRVKAQLEEERTRIDAAIVAIDRLIAPSSAPRVAQAPSLPRRKTPPRSHLKTSILTLLETSGDPITTSEIAKALKKRGYPRTSYASVYNTLARIERTGEGVVKLGSAWQLGKPVDAPTGP